MGPGCRDPTQTTGRGGAPTKRIRGCRAPPRYLRFARVPTVKREYLAETQVSAALFMSSKTRPGRSRRRRRLDAGAGPSSSAGPGPKAPNGGMGDSASTGRAMLDVFIEQLEWHWTNQLRPRLDGLTDEE